MPTCKSCMAEKPKSEFYRRAKALSGISHICKACSNKATQEWRANNRLKNASNARNWAASNPDKIKASAKTNAEKSRERNVKRATEWAKQNPNRRREIANDWVRSNPAKVNSNVARYRSSKIKATPAWANRFYINEAYHLAKLRELVCGGKWEVDHIVPLRGKTVCGLHVHTNVRVIRKSDNMVKSNRRWPDMP